MKKEQAINDLNYIKQIIEDTKKTTVDNGIGFIIWGIIVSIGLVSTYFLIITKNFTLTTPIWTILISGGWIYSIIESIKKKKRNVIRSYTDKVVGSVWASLGVVMTILGFYATNVGALQYLYLASFMALQVGIGFFITATIFKQNYMIVIAIVWWISALFTMAFPGLYVLLAMGIMMLLFQVAPGIYIYLNYKSQIIEDK